MGAQQLLMLQEWMILTENKRMRVIVFNNRTKPEMTVTNVNGSVKIAGVAGRAVIEP